MNSKIALTFVFFSFCFCAVFIQLFSVETRLDAMKKDISGLAEKTDKVSGLFEFKEPKLEDAPEDAKEGDIITRYVHYSPCEVGVETYCVKDGKLHPVKPL